MKYSILNSLTLKKLGFLKFSLIIYSKIFQAAMQYSKFPLKILKMKTSCLLVCFNVYYFCFHFRVVQKNLVFVVGLSQRLAEPDVLKKHEYFGKFGKIHKVVINQSTSYAGAQVSFNYIHILFQMFIAIALPRHALHVYKVFH